jgi:hypothetical protein
MSRTRERFQRCSVWLVGLIGLAVWVGAGAGGVWAGPPPQTIPTVTPDQSGDGIVVPAPDGISPIAATPLDPENDWRALPLGCILCCSGAALVLLGGLIWWRARRRKQTTTS